MVPHVAGTASLLPAMQLSSLPCMCPGKSLSQVEKGTLWGNIFTFSILWRPLVSKWPSPFHPRVLTSLFAFTLRLISYGHPLHSLHSQDMI